MIKIGTVFSGIGAIEHALQRMNIEHEIVFACDNGDVDILSKKIPIDLISIQNEIRGLEALVSKINCKSAYDKEYILELKTDLDRASYKFTEEIKNIENISSCSFIVLIEDILACITGQEALKDVRMKEYLEFIKEIEEKKDTDKIFFAIKTIVKIINDFSKDNSLTLLHNDVKLDKTTSRDNIEWVNISSKLQQIYQISENYEFKKIIKEVKNICESLSMLHERINTFHILKELENIESYKEKKKYVDGLYKEKEKQNKVKTSYFANYDINKEDFHWNVSFLDGNQYRDEVDLFVGGSPCQSFSLVGKQKGLDDTRGTLFYEYARLVSEIRPKIFIYENVKAVLSNDNGKTWETMQKVFTELDYNWSHSILNAKEYGIPQNRERLFVVGFRNDLVLDKEFIFPTSIELTKKMQDFLIDNVSGKYYLPQKGVDFVTSEKNLSKRYTQIDGDIQLCQKKNQQFNWHGDFVFVEENKDMEKTMHDLEKYFLSEKVKKYVLATGTKGFYSRPETDLEIARPLLTTMHKMHRAGVDNYVTTEGRLRKLTPRECLRLMGFCDSFKIKVSDTSMYQQAGNSIVVDVLIELMGQIIESYPNLIGEEKINEQ